MIYLMNIHHILLILHLLSATIWVGGHLFLWFAILPKAVFKGNLEVLKDFKNRYEPVGMPALIILVITGIYMAYNYGVKVGTWLSFSSPIERVVSIKIILLIITVICAIIADKIIFPNLSNKNIKIAALLISTVTFSGVTMVILGSFVRFGGL